MKTYKRPPTHVIIPDTQVKPGVDTRHLDWIGQYIADEFAQLENVTLIHLGDHWDMPSLSSYDRGKKAMEGRRYLEDIDAGNDAFVNLDGYIRGEHLWLPRKVFLRGNHEYRIERASESDPQLDGLLSYDALETTDWEVHDYKEPVVIDGVTYAHLFYHPRTGRPYAGENLETRLKTIGHSFTMGHQQGLKWGRIDGIHGGKVGLIAGSCYLHDEEYLGPQTVNYWRGIIVAHQVENGDYDPMFVSLDYLCRRYEGMRLSTYLSKKKWRKL